jgi:hypothetical protein
MMSNKESSFSFGNVSGNVTVNKAGRDINHAGHDIVGRDKITTADNATTTYNGFKKEQNKEQFLTEIENLRTLLRAIKGEVEASTKVDQDQKDELSLALMQQAKALKDVKDQAANLPTGKEAPEAQTFSITDCLDKTKNLMEKAEAFGEKAAEFTIKATPILAILKSLFGF